MAKIGVLGQYVVELGVPKQGGGYTPIDDVSENDLVALEITEKADNVLPIARLHFTTADDNIALRINESQPIVIAAGIDDKMLSPTEFLPINPSIRRRAANEWAISTNLVLNVPEYANTAKVKVYGLADAVSVAKSILGAHFNVHGGSIPKSDDQMNYIQPAISDMEFVRNLSRHAWLNQGDSWNVVALTTEVTTEATQGKKPSVRVFDMAKQITMAKAGNYFWHFTNLEPDTLLKKQQQKPSNKSESSSGQGNKFIINYAGDYTFVSPTGLLNQLAGYDRTNLDYDMDSAGVWTQQAILSKSHLTNSANWTRSAGKQGPLILPPNFGAVGHNTHQQYFLAAHSNLANRALFSSFQCQLSYDNGFYPHQLLDIAQLSITSAKAPNEVNPALSGLYIISGITRSWTGKRLRTTVTLVREGPEGGGGGGGGSIADIGQLV